MTTQPLARYGARNGALASGLTTTSYTTFRDTTVRTCSGCFAGRRYLMSRCKG